MKRLVKTVYTLCVDDYAPEVTAITFPRMEAYAEKIEADFVVIRDRVFPGWPAAYEKLQVGMLGRANGSDWNIFFDADTLIHPNTPDFTALVGKDTVVHYASDMALMRWRLDEYLLRDGRWIGSANWCAIASDWCLDFWTPLDISLEEAVSRIHPLALERANGITPEHLIDDFTMSRNIARYGLKFKSILKDIAPGEEFFFHVFMRSEAQKAAEMRMVLSRKSWGGDIDDALLGPLSAPAQPQEDPLFQGAVLLGGQ